MMDNCWKCFKLSRRGVLALAPPNTALEQHRGARSLPRSLGVLSGGARRLEREAKMWFVAAGVLHAHVRSAVTPSIQYTASHRSRQHSISASCRLFLDIGGLTVPFALFRAVEPEPNRARRNRAWKCDRTTSTAYADALSRELNCPIGIEYGRSSVHLYVGSAGARLTSMRHCSLIRRVGSWSGRFRTSG